MTRPLLQNPLAIVGMACRLPGADTLDEYWELLRSGGDAVTELPADRLDRELYFDAVKGTRGKTYSSVGGLISKQPVDAAVAALAGDSRDTDPSHRILLDVAMRALRHAGVDPLQMSDPCAGVYVGHSSGSPQAGELAFATLATEIVDYLRDTPGAAALPEEITANVIDRVAARLRSGRPRRDPGGGPDLEAREAANIIARSLGLTGPQRVVDAACSSSLVALALGAMDLQQGRVHTAIVGGASYLKADSLALFSQAQSCSPTGSRPFDAEADGLVAAEGYVVLVLKTLPRALADGDTVRAVIRGLGLSSDGRGRSLWAPQKDGQVEALRRAYSNGVDPADIGYIEAHATSTQVGDATEIEALASFFAPLLDRRTVPIGSVKSNIGHTLETAGLAGLLKTVLALEHAVIPPTIHVERLNPALDWPQLPFSVPTEPVPWPRPSTGRPRRGGVNAFGIGGINVHVAVEEFLPDTDGHNSGTATRTATNDETGTARDNTTSDIAIIGRGVILPGAQSVPALAELSRSGRSAISDAPTDRWRGHIGVEPGTVEPWRSPTCRGGFVRDYQHDWRRHRIPPKQLARANPLQFMLLDAADQALREAGYDQRAFDRARTAVVVGTNFGAEFGNQLVAGLRLPEIRRALVQELSQLGLTDDAVDDIADQFEERLLEAKPALLDETGGFTASSLASLISKTLDLKGGFMAIEPGVHDSLAPLATACDLLGTGAASLVLCAGAQRLMDLSMYESLAMKGRLLNEDSPNDSPDSRQGVVPGEGVAMVLLKRLADAKRDGEVVLGVVPAHGVDPASERESSLVEQIGDTQAARGLVTLVEHTLLGQAATTGVAAGHAAVPHSRIIRFGARHSEDLRKQLEQAMTAPRRSFVDAMHKSFTSADAARAAIVATDPDSLAATAKLAVKRWPQLEHDVVLDDRRGFWTRATMEPGPPRTAFLFSGLGSQYPGMLQGLATHSPAARETLAEAEAILARLGLGSFAEMAWGDSASLSTDLWMVQASLLVADLLVYAAVTERGVRPHVVAGHSYGEFPAMVAAGIWTLEQALRATRIRAEAIAASPASEGRLLSIQASANRIEGLLETHGGSLQVTHRNAPKLSVVGGPADELTAFDRVLTQHGFITQPLAVPAAFHTPFMEEVEPALRDWLAREPLLPPTTPLLSNVTIRYEADPEQIRANLVAQLTSPVDYTRLVQRLSDDGVGVFIEVGPQQVLTGLNRQILGPGALCIASDHRRRNADEQLNRVQALVECVGAMASPSPATRGETPTVAGSTTTSLSPIEHFDATIHRKQRLRHSALATDGDRANRPSQEEDSPEVRSSDHLETVLIDFVVEQTGYPPDVVELDADLEADLGIDSIKKAQLFGELREMFSLDLGDTGTLQLTDFPTLGHVLLFLRDQGVKDGPYPDPAGRPDPGTNATPGGEPGSPYERGVRLGRARAQEIRSALRRGALVNPIATTTPAEPTRHLSSTDLEKLRGVAQGAEVLVDNVVAYQRRADSPDLLTALSASENRGTGGISDETADSDRSPTNGFSSHNDTLVATPHLTSTDTRSAAAAMDGEPAAGASSVVTSRYTLGVTEAPLPAGSPVTPQLSGAVLVLGANETGDALSEKLRGLGATVHVVAPTSDPSEAVGTLEALWEQSPIHHVFVVTSRDADAATRFDADHWSRRRAQGVMTPFQLCQRWLTLVQDAELMDDASLVAVTSLGGDFGFERNVVAAEGGALSGLLKAILIESWVNGFRAVMPIKIIDIPPDESAETIADVVCRELAVPSYDTEIAWAHGKRSVVRAVATTAAAPDRTISAGQTWVCTGGARGITAYVARGLAVRYGLKLHLLGTAPLPDIPDSWRQHSEEESRALKRTIMQTARLEGHSPIQAWDRTEKALEIDQTLHTLRELGVAVTYHSCDVADRDALDKVLSRVRELDGPIDGVLHGAGLGRDARFAFKDPARVDRCIRAKADGALALMDLTRQDPLQHFVAFGSISGRFGANGQTDYSLANDLLAKQVDWYRQQRPDVAAVTLHWHAWDDVGMSIKPETRLALAMIDMRLMPAEEGLAHLVNELEGGTPDGEVLLTDDRYYRLFYASETVTRPAQNDVDGTDGAPQCPLIDATDIDDQSRHATTSSRLNPTTDPFLVEHRLDGKPLLPIVVGLEMLCEASVRLTGRNEVGGLRDIVALDGLRFHGSDIRAVHVAASRLEDGSVRSELRSDVRRRDGRLVEAGRPYLTATIDPRGSSPAARSPIPRPPDAWQPVPYPERDAKFYLGPPLRCLRKIQVARDRAWGRIIAPAAIELVGPDRDVTGWVLPSAALDACLYATGLLAWQRVKPGVSLPVSIGVLTLGRRPTPGERCLVEVRLTGTEDNHGRFNFRLCGCNGDLIFEAEDYRIAWLSE